MNCTVVNSTLPLNLLTNNLITILLHDVLILIIYLFNFILYFSTKTECEDSLSWYANILVIV